MVFDTSPLEFENPAALLEPASNTTGTEIRVIRLIIDWNARIICAETKDPNDRSILRTRWDRLEDAYILPPTVDATRLREWVEAEVVPRALPLADVFETKWKNGHLVGHFPHHEAMKDDFDYWMERCIEPPMQDGWIWTAAEWLEMGVPELRPDTTDEELEILTDDLMREAAQNNIVIVGGEKEVYEYLKILRSRLL